MRVILTVWVSRNELAAFKHIWLLKHILPKYIQIKRILSTYPQISC